MRANGVSSTDDLARDNPIPGLVDPLDLPHPGVGPVRAVARFYQNYAKFSGRASRSEFWWVPVVLALFDVLRTVYPGIGSSQLHSAAELYPGSPYPLQRQQAAGGSPAGPPSV